MNEVLRIYRENQERNITLMNKLEKRNFFFRLFLLRILPMAFFAGLRVSRINEEECVIAVPYKWLNKNPFRSTYFAVLGMGAEMSTGLPAFQYTWKSKPAVSMLVTGVQGSFAKKATDTTYFTFSHSKQMKLAIEKAIETGEGVTFEAETTGRNLEGKEIARFVLTWSFRVKPL